MKKISSGIPLFDTLIGGGFPVGRSYLVSGEPGVGKTIFSLQFLLEGLKKGERALFVSIDEKAEHIIIDAKELGWDLSSYLASEQLQIIDATSSFSDMTDLSWKGGSLHARIIHDIVDCVKGQEIQRIAIDPVAPLVFSKDRVHDVFEYIRNLIFSIESIPNCTSLMTSYIPVGSSKVSLHGIEEFLTSGTITLQFSKAEKKRIRTISVRKMRSTSIDLTEYTFEIIQNRGIVLRQAI